MFSEGLGLAANACNFGSHLTPEPPSPWLTDNLVETSMDGVLIALKVDRIVGAAVWYEDHGRRFDVSMTVAEMTTEVHLTLAW